LIEEGWKEVGEEGRKEGRKSVKEGRNEGRKDGRKDEETCARCVVVGVVAVMAGRAAAVVMASEGSERTGHSRRCRGQRLGRKEREGRWEVKEGKCDGRTRRKEGTAKKE
jgi:hypothetical protein